MENRSIDLALEEISKKFLNIQKELDYLLAKKRDDNAELQSFYEDDDNYIDESLLKSSLKMFAEEGNILVDAANKQRLLFNKNCRKVAGVSSEFILKVADNIITCEKAPDIANLIRLGDSISEKASIMLILSKEANEIYHNILKKKSQLSSGQKD